MKTNFNLLQKFLHVFVILSMLIAASGMTSTPVLAAGECSFQPDPIFLPTDGSSWGASRCIEIERYQKFYFNVSNGYSYAVQVRPFKNGHTGNWTPNVSLYGHTQSTIAPRRYASIFSWFSENSSDLDEWMYINVQGQSRIYLAVYGQEQSDYRVAVIRVPTGVAQPFYSRSYLDYFEGKLSFDFAQVYSQKTANLVGNPYSDNGGGNRIHSWGDGYIQNFRRSSWWGDENAIMRGNWHGADPIWLPPNFWRKFKTVGAVDALGYPQRSDNIDGMPYIDFNKDARNISTDAKNISRLIDSKGTLSSGVFLIRGELLAFWNREGRFNMGRPISDESVVTDSRWWAIIATLGGLGGHACVMPTKQEFRYGFLYTCLGDTTVYHVYYSDFYNVPANKLNDLAGFVNSQLTDAWNYIDRGCFLPGGITCPINKKFTSQEIHGMQSDTWQKNSPVFTFPANPYSVYWGSSPSGGGIIGLESGGGSVSYVTQGYYAPTVLTDGVYYLRAQAVSDPGASGWETVFILKYDGTPPTSSVLALPASQTSTAINVNWSGSDNLSGIAAYDVQYRLDNGIWQDWLSGTTTTSGVFTAQPGHTYYFRSRAIDQAGNIEAYPNGNGDAWITIFAPPTLTPTNTPITPTNTTVPSLTPTKTYTPIVPTPTQSNTPVGPTNTPILTSTPTKTYTLIPPSNTPVLTLTLTKSNTPVTPTSTPVLTSTLVSTNTSVIPTNTPVSTSTFTKTYTPISPTHTLVPTSIGSSLLQNITKIIAGVEHTCALASNGVVKCWGINNNGQLGDGTNIQRLTPVDVIGLTSDVIDISAGGYHTCALTSTGGVKCWGSNANGQLGDGTTVFRFIPVDVNVLNSGVIAITSGYAHTCALILGGVVKCWGNNSYGQLGDNTTEEKQTPVNVSGITGIQAISAGNSHTCALTSNGGIKCWGSNTYGQLGDGTTTQRVVPVDVIGLTSGVNAIVVARGSENYYGSHTCALTSNGGIKCWGSNAYGQLGDGTTVEKHTPVNVSNLTNGTSAITASWFHSCALISSGAVKCWGYNGLGRLGDGTSIDRYIPVGVSGLNSGVSAVKAGWYHTCALTLIGGVKCWGANSSGQLGDGTTTERYTPVDVLAGTGLPTGFVPNQKYASFSNSLKAQEISYKTTGSRVGKFSAPESAPENQSSLSSFSIPLYPGDNFISLPLHPENTDIAQVLASIDGNYSLVEFQNACDVADPDKEYIPGGVSNDLLQLDESMGFWVTMTTADTLTVTGTPVQNPQINLCPGNNSVGYPSLDGQPVNIALQGILGNYSHANTYLASDVADHWKAYNPSYSAGLQFLNDLHQMQPGHGYSINTVSQAGVWQIPLVATATPTVTPTPTSTATATATPTSSTAPLIEASADNDFVIASGWPSGALTLTIDDPSTAEQVDYSVEGGVGPSSGAYGYFNLNIFNTTEKFDLQPGYLITIRGGGVERSHTVAHLAVIDFDLNAETMSGTGAPADEVQVQACAGAICRIRYATPDGNGEWSANFSGLAGVDLTSNALGWVTQRNLNENQTWAIWDVNNPHIEASADDNFVAAYEWPIGTVTLTIDDPSTAAQVDYSVQAEVGSNLRNPLYFNLDTFEVLPGQLLTISGSGVTRTYTVANLKVASFDLDTNTISGTGAPGDTVQIQACTDSCKQRSGIVDTNGTWMADYGGLDNLDLTPGTIGWAVTNDANNNQTLARWYIHNPRIEANSVENFVKAYDWPTGTVTMTIDNPSTPAAVDYSAQDIIELGGFVNFNLDSFDLQPGYVLTVSGGGVERSYTVANLAVTNFDLSANTISGTGAAGQVVQVQACGDHCSVLYVMPDANGAWTADFSGSGDFDLVPGVGGWVSQKDANTNQSWLTWQVNTPYIEANLDSNTVNAYDWPSDTINLTIDNPLTAEVLDYEETAFGLSPGESAHFNLDMFNLQPGQLLTVSGGGIERTYTVANIAVTSFDLSEDTISGVGTSGDSLQLQACAGIICGNRDAIPDEIGAWTVDYNGFDGVDLVPGISGLATQRDVNGNQTRVNWQINTPHIEASLDGNFIDVYSWLSGTVSLTINDPSTNAEIDYNAENMMGSKPWEAVHFDLNTFDLKPGQILTVNGSSIEHAYTVANLSITGFDLDANTVSGTGMPGKEVHVQTCTDSCKVRLVTPNLDGNWLANYSGSDGVDLIPGSSGSTVIGTAGEDQTRINWQVNNPRIEANLNENIVNAYDWPIGSVTLTINDPITLAEIDLSLQDTMSQSRIIHFSLDTFILKPGQLLTISGSGLERTYTVANLVVTNFDLNTDMISGSGTPGKQAQIQVCVEIVCKLRSITSDVNGKWIADYSGANGLDLVSGASDLIIEGNVNENQTWSGSSKFSNYFISGNVGIADVTLSYMDGVHKTVLSDVDGNYWLTIPSHWSGVVNPYKAGYIFTPNYSYTNVTSNKIAQNYTATLPTLTLTPTVTPTATPTPTRTLTMTSTPTPTKVLIAKTLQSISSQDGWTLESSEISKKGSTINTGSTTFNLGDDAAKKQYRSILSFSTGASLPDTAIITNVMLRIKKSTISGGGNPVKIFTGFMVDIKNGFFGKTALLQASDFQMATSKSYGPFNTALVGGWYSIDLTDAKPYINSLSARSGLTQIRLRFKLDDNNNAVANYLSLYSGNAPIANRPQLVITYFMP